MAFIGVAILGLFGLIDVVRLPKHAGESVLKR
jgi:hypothetical protein